MADPAADRDQLIVEHLPLVHRLARRYAHRGEPLDDLVQAGTIGLIKAVDRFDPTRSDELATFAAPTILGEIRRHFRDRTWVVRVPRGVQEARAEVVASIEILSARLGRSPSVAELAQETGLDIDDVLDALAAASAQRPDSLTRAPAGEEEQETEIRDHDRGYEEADARVALEAALPELPPRERRILHLRFVEGLTQSEIADQIGISQMHVSRLLRRSLDALRASPSLRGASEDDDAESARGTEGL